MDIQLSTGLGIGTTKLSAFDSALYNAGVANFNLLRLSSVIPPKSKIISLGDKQKVSPKGEWGDRLYVVMAEMRADTPNVEAWAGIGWIQDTETGQGLFVEHEGNSEKAVRRDIKDSLIALMATRNIDYGPINMEVVGTTCTHMPVCAMVVAVYESSSWQTAK